MKTIFHRILLVQRQGELASYTASLLDEIGFRHVVHASDVAQAERLWKNAQEKQRPFQLVLCDDEVEGGSLALEELVAPLPLLVLSHPTNPRNLRLAARLGLNNLVFRPYGRHQLSQALGQLLS